jgi:hypothetical protein
MHAIKQIIGKPSDFKEMGLLPNLHKLKFNTAIMFDLMLDEKILKKDQLKEMSKIFINAIDKVKIKFKSVSVKEEYIKITCDVTFEEAKKYLSSLKVEYKGKYLTAHNFSHYSMFGKW